MVRDLVLIDTSAWIVVDRPRRGEDIKARVKEILDEDRAATTGIVTGELLSGARMTKEYKELEQDLRALHYLLTPDHIWSKTARIGFDLRRKGVTVPFTDLLIASLCLENGCSLLHADGHFDLIASKTNLKVESFI